MLVICIKQHLSNIFKVSSLKSETVESNTEARLKKVLLIKKRVSYIFIPKKQLLRDKCKKQNLLMLYLLNTSILPSTVSKYFLFCLFTTLYLPNVFD